MAAKALSYTYQSLAKHQIRLLRLDPGRDEDIIEGSLEIVGLRDSPAYEALSYEWGLPDKSREAIIDGSVIPITESLFRALQDLRLRNGKSRVLWADAICINQDDIDERQHQVSVMGAIYRQASRVITYIGPETDDSTDGIRLATKLMRFQYSDEPIVLGTDASSTARLAALGLPPATDPGWQALKALCLRGWVSNMKPSRHFLRV